ncbi:flagellar hook-associated protein FlgL [Jeotgalibacillus soli]|uniref:Flagellin N-terminal domain-containing protein n=1 Tax=Jeotgalibacillus soli TaxID=889306 RepID=A0A0C2S7B6_9BACL|nr:flagellar hook-associated protein FlgL [Jeotgalibacillus soli]KIL49914.1 hypothetical protein KP78_13820 [Jeotgalibacillus soli]
MRITQSMLSNNSLRHLSQSYQRMQTYQDQLNTGKKITKPSQDPVVAMKGIRYRTEVMETRQYLDRNLAQVYSWVENADSSLDKVGEVMKRVRDLTVQASNDTYDENQRKSLSEEVTQLIAHIGTLTNTKVNNQYIFNGTDTINPPYNAEGIDINPSEIAAGNENTYILTYNSKTFEWDDTANGGLGAFTDGTAEYVLNGTVFEEASTGTVLPANDVVVIEKSAIPSNNESINIEIMKGIELGVNIAPGESFSSTFFGDLHVLQKKLSSGAKGEELSSFIGKLDKHMDAFLSKRSEIGAKYNRVEMIENRLSEQEVIATKVMSENEDVDAERVIIDMLSEETLLRATLASSSRIIQPTLMDFLR